MIKNKDPKKCPHRRQGQGRQRIHDKVDEQELDRGEGALSLFPQGHRRRRARHCRHVDDQLELHEARHRRVDVAAPGRGAHDAAEGVVEEEDVGGGGGDGRAGGHGEPDVGRCQRRGVGDAVCFVLFCFSFF